MTDLPPTEEHQPAPDEPLSHKRRWLGLSTPVAIAVVVAIIAWGIPIAQGFHFGCLRRGVAFGVIAVVTLAPTLTLALVLSGFPELTRGQFVVYQVAFAVAIGAVLTPVIALYAMAD